MDIRKTVQKPLSFITGILLVLSGLHLFRLAAVVKKAVIARSLLGIAAVILAVFLIQQKRWALRTTALLLLLIACGLPMGVFDPFTVVDSYLAAGKEPPTIAESLAWMIPVEILLLLAAYSIDPPRDPK